MIRPLPFLLLAAVACFSTPTCPAADIYIGSGVKSGEVTDTTAIILVRLTSTPGQDAKGNIPGREGEARLEYSPTESLASATHTNWQAANPKADWSIHFQLRDLKTATRYFYRVEYRTSPASTSERSETFSFLTAPSPSDRTAVKFHLTTCQDLHGFNIYIPMAAQKPDFVISD